MVYRCAAYKCKEKYIRGRTNVSFHKFPNDPLLKQSWIEITRKSNFIPKGSFICSKHFREDCFELRTFGPRKLKPNAIPTILTNSKENEKTEIIDATDDTSSTSNSPESSFLFNEDLTDSKVDLDITCSAYNCYEKLQSDSKIVFYKFPTGIELRDKWIEALNNEYFVPTDNSYLCSKHFTSECFTTTENTLKDDAVPTIFNFSERRKSITNEPEGLVLNEVDLTDPLLITTTETDKSEKTILQPIYIQHVCGHVWRKEFYKPKDNEPVGDCCVTGCNINTVDNPSELFHPLPFNHKLNVCKCIQFVNKSDPAEFIEKDLVVCQKHYEENLILFLENNEIMPMVSNDNDNSDDEEISDDLTDQPIAPIFVQMNDELIEIKSEADSTEALDEVSEDESCEEEMTDDEIKDEIAEQELLETEIKEENIKLENNSESVTQESYISNNFYKGNYYNI